MQKKMAAEVNRYIGRKRRRRIWTKAVVVLACIVVFCTAYALILPAVALEGEKEPYCGYEEHQHTDSCYETELICREGEASPDIAEGYEIEAARMNGNEVTGSAYSAENDGVENAQIQEEEENRYYSKESVEAEALTAEGRESGEGHTHTDDCYQTEKVLVCGVEEEAEHHHDEGCFETGLICETEEENGHSHTDDCYQEEERLTCEQEEDENHSHTDACYETVETLCCGQEESDGHVHAETCYGPVETCGPGEGSGHVHTEECYEIKSVQICEQDETAGADGPEKQEIKEGTEAQEEEQETGAYEAADEKQDHIHTDECYGEKLICSMEEHIHTLSCYSDLEADVETAEVWEKTLPEEMSGIWADDLVAVAKSQLRYKESTANYDVTEEEEVKGYTRYGEWYGDPYGEWNAMFAAFCLNYAKVPEKYFPVPENDGDESIDCQAWIGILEEETFDLYVKAQDYEQPHAGDLVFFDSDGDGEADRVGIVEEYTEKRLISNAEIKVIEGDSEDEVRYVTYDTEDESILGYALMPENQTTLVFEGEGYTVAITYGPDAELPDDVALEAGEYGKNDEIWQERCEEAAESCGWEEDKTDSIRLFHLSLNAAGEEVEPAAPVQVTMTYGNRESEKSYTVIHFKNGGEIEAVSAVSGYEDGVETVQFTLDSFSDVMTIEESVAAKVESFYLWLHAREESQSQWTKVYGNSEWDYDADGNRRNGIEDALTYTADGETWYLIPVSYLLENYEAYGYSFDAENAGTCPIRFLRDAKNSVNGQPNAGLEPASYVQVNGKWYVRVADETGVPPARSNLYYAPSNAFTLTYGDHTVTFQMVDEYGSPIYGDYSGYSITADGGTKYVFVENGRELPTAGLTGSEQGEICALTVPVIDGYTYSGAKLENDRIASVATGGFINYGGNNFNVFQFYITEPIDTAQTGQWYTKGGNATVTLTYKKEASVVQDSVSPSGTVINLFDYWTTTPIEKDVSDNKYESGINAGHPFKFKATGLSGANTWTKSEAVYQGIVNPVLTGGYPVLTEKEIFGQENGSLSGNESLEYLFNPETSVEYRKAYRNVSGLLQVDDSGYYYYDSKKNYAEFDSDSNRFILYDDWAVTYTPHAGETSNVVNNGQFFPFDAFDTVNHSTNAGSDNLNHFFGMTLTARFIQQYDGHTDARKNTDMIFDFSGDDDVWIFIDDVLVADLGGIHDIASVDINFATGKVTINEKSADEIKKVSTIKQAFIAAGKASEADTEGWNGNTFANDTYHTLKFFYLERGSYASNLYLKYNLNVYPPTSVYKVDQYGETVEGATFAVYAADENYNILSDKGGEAVVPENSASTYVYDDRGNIIGSEGNSTGVFAKALYIGTTDQKGEMIFVDEDNVPYTLADLENMFGDHFVLKEIGVPQGYRLVSDIVKLYIYNHKVLMCEDTYSSGVFTDASVLITAPSQIWRVDKNPISYVNEKGETTGTLFAVVLKYTGPTDGAENEGGNITAAAPLTKKENWAPVHGTAVSGFTVVDVEKDDNGSVDDKAFVAAVIDTAKKYVESQNVFAISASGQAQAQLNGLPGNIQNYYYMLKGDEKNKTEYTIAYYYSTAASLDGANADNTIRVDADAEGYAFTRSFGATIAVPNLINRLFAQKLDETGGLVNGAGFALYKVVQPELETGKEQEAKIYYVANDGTMIYLEADVDGDNKDAAQIYKKNESDGTYTVNTGTYTIDAGTGIISVKAEGNGSNNSDGDGSYTIEPVAVETTLSADDEKNPAKEDGTACFTNMDDGYYYLREISAPDGYRLNTTEVMVLVDETAVYANAGTAYDGVTVGRGPGYVCKTLSQFASEGEIDNTLTWVYEQMLVSPVSGRFQDVYEALTPGKWQYLKSYEGSGFNAKTETVGISENSLSEVPEGTLTTYLVYAPGDGKTLFNYTVNSKRYLNNNTENVTRRLYTSVGWSYYLLYQDYDYGNVNHKAANYTDLRGEEISNLFSRSTFVQVTDRINELIIKKADGDTLIEVKDNSGQIIGYTYETLKGAQFTLARTIIRSDGVTETSYYQVETKESADDNSNTAAVITADWVTVEPNGKIPVFGTDENGAIAIQGLTDGAYALTEVKAPDGYQLLENSFLFTVRGGKVVATSENKVIVTNEQTEGSEAVENNDSDIVLIILNNKGYMLPNTGGPGTDLFTIGGVLLMAGTVGCGYRLRRRRERREKV